MKKAKKLLCSLLLFVSMVLTVSTPVLADSIGDAGGTGQGGITGGNVYTFSYNYCSTHDAIELTVNTKNAISSFGNTKSHTFHSTSDQTVLNTSNPQLGNSLENAIATMNAVGGYNLSAGDAKAALNGLGYYDKGNGVWKYNGGYLTYVSAIKIRPTPKVHTVTYDANGGSGAPGNQTKTEGYVLTLSSKKPTRTGYTFKYWNASIGGTYSPGGSYGHDQDGGTVTMKAYWKDETDPSCSSFSAVPNSWSAGNGTVSFTARDQGSGLASVVLKRYSYVTNRWSDIKTWSYSGTTSSQSGSYTETSEGVFYYTLTIKDKAGNVTVKTSATIYLDHSNPVIYGTENTVTSWTKTAPVINVSATDYLLGTSYNGSGVKKLEIKNASGGIVSSGTTSARYTLADSYQGICTWTIVATDYVGHVSTKTITTRFDKSGPDCSDFRAVPNSWSAGNGSVTFTARDAWSGLASATLERYSYVTKSWTTVRTWNFYNVTSTCSGSYTETSEGVFYYKLTLKDALGNATVKTSATIYLDHSNPVISGVNTTVTDWTNIAPIINVSATDFLIGTSYNGSGLSSVVIKDDAGIVVARGTNAAMYTLQAKYEGIHTWYIVATDSVGHVTNASVTTKYDITKPGMDGTEVTFVVNGVNYSGYCQDDLISQHIDDEAVRSVNHPNCTSGLKSVIVYRVLHGTKTGIYSSSTQKNFGASDTHTSFDVFYDAEGDSVICDYYEVVASDYAGNITKKKLVTQRTLLTRFHTSIDRSSYE